MPKMIYKNINEEGQLICTICNIYKFPDLFPMDIKNRHRMRKNYNCRSCIYDRAQKKKPKIKIITRVRKTSEETLNLYNLAMAGMV